MAKILLLNGPNLNLLGEREPEIYGSTTLKKIEGDVRSLVESRGHHLWHFQSNSEGEMVDWLQNNRDSAFLLLNAASFTHTSVALRDAVSLLKIPFAEIHISNVFKREPFRHQSYFSDLAMGVIAGFGAHGYLLAAQFALDHVDQSHSG
ncbi:MAG: type II 3-dehydroquinate dehydratase [Deltaproteobacteria bacterium]|nr:type II 3-dehydroquinate dehydratase [Deltaproteobacteria bacterium]